MKPRSRPESSQLQLFQAQLEQLFNHDHPLYVLAGQIVWARFEAALADCYSPDQGAPAKAVRLLVGLHYLKHTFNELDLARVNFDTPVQEKNITYPTNSKLLHKAIVKLGQAAKQRDVKLCQTYVRVAKKASVKAGRYAHAKQFKRLR